MTTVSDQVVGDSFPNGLKWEQRVEGMSHEGQVWESLKEGLSPDGLYSHNANPTQQSESKIKSTLGLINTA